MKTFKEIEAFIRKAMEEELIVYSGTYCIQVVKGNHKLVFDKYGTYLNIKLFNENHYIGGTEAYDLSEREDKEYDILLLDVKQYETNRIMNVFHSFFTGDNSAKTVDDLEFD